MSNPDDEEQRNQVLNNTKLLRRAQINLVRSKIDSIEQILANQEIDTIDNNGILAKKQTLCDKLVALDELNASILSATSQENIEEEVKSAAGGIPSCFLRVDPQQSCKLLKLHI